MCLAVPGRLLNVTLAEPLLRTGNVQFGSVIKEINLALVPEAVVGDYLVVHAGVAIATVDEREAEVVFDYLAQIVTAEEQAGFSR